MRILPILFNTEMVRGLQADMKTATRRVIKYSASDVYKSACFHGRWYGGMTVDNLSQSLIDWYCKEVKRPPYEPGDILYIRETWAKLYYVDPDGYTHYDQPMYYYAADGTPDIILCDGDGFEEDDQRIRWRPSIHMPKEAARIFLKVKAVRVERLQEITSEQIDAEGCKEWAYSAVTGELLPSAPTFFKLAWNETVKQADRDKYGWGANPWVWVIEFERTDKPEEWPRGKA